MLMGKTNTNALSDLGVASLQAYAGLEGAIMNVRSSIKDEKFVGETSAEISGLLEEGRSLKDNIYRHVSQNVG